MVKRVHLVEDEIDIAELLQHVLISHGYEVTHSENGTLGLQHIVDNVPDVAILDIMLPDMNGIEICRAIRANQNTNNLPVLMLSAKGEEQDIIKGLEAGADDYVSKPFSQKILLARLEAVMRRTKSEQKSEDEFVYQGIRINTNKHIAAIDGSEEELNLTKTEFDILKCLLVKPGWVLTRSQIVDAIRGEGYAITERSIDVQIVGLRKKLGEKGAVIETVRGVGYRLKG